MKVKSKITSIEYETGIKAFPIINVILLNESKYFLEVRSVPSDMSFVIFKNFSVLIWGLALMVNREDECFDTSAFSYQEVLENVTEEKLVDLSARTLTVDMKGQLYYDSNCFSPYKNVLKV